MGGELSDTLGKKVWYKCPACKEEKWAYETFVGHKCYKCMGLENIADASNEEMKKKDPEFLARRERFCTMSNGWALHPKSTYKYSNFQVLCQKFKKGNLTDNMVIDALKQVSPNNVNKYTDMINSSKYNTIGKRCIFLWTLESNIYHSVNKALNNDSYYDLQKWMPIIHGITTYNISAASKSYTTYRGSKIVAEQFDKWKIGQIYRMPQIVATSTSSSVADGFIKHNNGFKVIYNIDSGCFGNAKSVKPFSSIPTEDEILLPPYTAVKCIGKSKCNHTVTVEVLDNKYADQNVGSRYV